MEIKCATTKLKKGFGGENFEVVLLWHFLITSIFGLSGDVVGMVFTRPQKYFRGREKLPLCENEKKVKKIMHGELGFILIVSSTYLEERGHLVYHQGKRGDGMPDRTEGKEEELREGILFSCIKRRGETDKGY